MTQTSTWATGKAVTTRIQTTGKAMTQFLASRVRVRAALTQSVHPLRHSACLDGSRRKPSTPSSFMGSVLRLGAHCMQTLTALRVGLSQRTLTFRTGHSWWVFLRR
jgi:4'-phosphopantetheinyl transferase EntD